MLERAFPTRSVLKDRNHTSSSMIFRTLLKFN